MKLSPQTHESRAEQVLKCLRGYVTRQTWVPEDCAVIADILREWHDEVETLESRVHMLERECERLKLSLSDAGSVIQPGYMFAAHS